MRKPTLVAFGFVLLSATSCHPFGQRALDDEIERVRAHCTPENLLEIYRPDLFRSHSELVRQKRAEGPLKAGWRVIFEPFRITHSIPLVSKTTEHRKVLMYGSTRVADLKFINVQSNNIAVVLGIGQPTTLFTCLEMVRGFYADQSETNFRGT